MKTINVKVKENPYNIYIDYNLTGKIPAYIKKLNLGNFGIIIASKKVLSLHKKLINKTFSKKSYKIISVIDGEKAKSKKWLFKVIEAVVRADKLRRKVFVVCLGGGTIGDLGGFAASIYKRGIPYVQIPTTLLAQIDSSIGGKTAIDLNIAKNILGSFYQPRAVFIDPLFLKTLPNKEMKQGMAEAIKYGIIKSKDFFEFLKKNHEKIIKLDKTSILKVINTCAQIKAKIVSADEKEKKGLRTILNFGHTLAHALESCLQYKKITHGEAVALGMLYVTGLSYSLKMCNKACINEINEILKLFKLPRKIKANYLSLYKSLTYDKKFISGKIRMVLLKKIGQVQVIEGIKPQNLNKAFKSLIF